MAEVAHPNELMALAGQIYVRMRRCNGRIVDAVYMVKNTDYAREILDLALRQGDAELQMLAARYEGWLEPDEGLPPPPVLTLPVAAPAPAPVAVEPKPMPEPAPVPTDEEVALHYIGALR